MQVRSVDVDDVGLEARPSFLLANERELRPIGGPARTKVADALGETAPRDLADGSTGCRDHDDLLGPGVRDHRPVGGPCRSEAPSARGQACPAAGADIEDEYVRSVSIAYRRLIEETPSVGREGYREIGTSLLLRDDPGQPLLRIEPQHATPLIVRGSDPVALWTPFDLADVRVNRESSFTGSIRARDVEVPRAREGEGLSGIAHDIGESLAIP